MWQGLAARRRRPEAGAQARKGVVRLSVGVKTGLYRRVAFVAIVLTVFLALGSAGGPPPVRAESPVPAPPAESLSAQAVALLDAATGEILLEYAGDKPLAPASLVKMMTLYLAFDAVRTGATRPADPVSVSETAWRATGSRMFIEVGEQVPVEELLHGIAIVSGNDACIAIAEHLAGSEAAFTARMNERAAELGLSRTRFANSHGLPADGQRMSAIDAARLGAALMRDFPDLSDILAQREYEYGGIKQFNRNTLLWKDPSVDGIKTGYTSEAGYSLVVSASRDGMHLVAAVMACPDEEARAADAAALLEYGFAAFETVEALTAGRPCGTARVWQGRANEVGLTVSQTVSVTVPRGSAAAVSVGLHPRDPLRAPLTAGEEVGRAVVLVDGESREEVPLLAAGDIARGSLWRVFWDWLRLLFHRGS